MQSKNIIIVLFFAVISTSVMFSILTTGSDDPAVTRAEVRLTLAKLQLKHDHLERNADLFYYGLIGFLSAAAVIGMILAAAQYRVKVKAASVHTYKIGSSEIVVHERDLHLAAPIGMGLVTAEKLRETNGGAAKALQLYSLLADSNSKLIRSLPAIPAHTGSLPQVDGVTPSAPRPAPTFSDLLRSGDIGPGKPLIFGFRRDTGEPERGDLRDQYSCIVIGLSGFGKTTFLAYHISAAVYACRAVFDVLDLHYPHQESLGAALGDLAQTPYINIIHNPILLPDTIDEYRRELAHRLAQPNTQFSPRVLVCDEHERWSKNKALVDLEMEIVNEGRKANMFLYVTSKSAKADKIGDSALRDNCVTSYVFKTKPQNARTFFDHDKEKLQLVKQLRAAGEAVFTNIKDDSMIVNVPFATLDDMRMVSQYVVNGSSNIVATERNVAQRCEHVASPLRPEPEESNIVAHLRAVCEKRGKLSEIAEKTGIDKGTISWILKGKRTPTDEQKKQIESVLHMDSNVIRFPQK